MEYKDKLNLCIKEIEVVQSNIARFDSNGSSIKSWCVTLWSGVSAYAISQREPMIALLGVAIVVGFSLMELTYRRFQKRFINRAAAIEELLPGDLSSYEFSIHRSAEKRDAKEIRSVLRMQHFVTYYIVLLIFSIVIAIFCWRYPSQESAFYLRIPL